MCRSVEIWEKLKKLGKKLWIIKFTRNSIIKKKPTNFDNKIENKVRKKKLQQSGSSGCFSKKLLFGQNFDIYYN